MTTPKTKTISSEGIAFNDHCKSCQTCGGYPIMRKCSEGKRLWKAYCEKIGMEYDEDFDNTITPLDAFEMNRARQQGPVDTGKLVNSLRMGVGRHRDRKSAMQVMIDNKWAELKAKLPEAPYGCEWHPHVVKKKIKGSTQINITAQLRFTDAD